MADPVEHVVVLMMENHSFDQMLGGLSGTIPGLDGVDPKNPKSNPDCPDTSKSVIQAPTPETSIGLDPAHEFDDVQRQMVGNNSGFVKDFVMAHPNCKDEDKQMIMAYYADGTLPVLHTLAKNFAVCDRWFSSMPGPTWPNRLFVHSGTCKGHVKMPSGIFDPNWHLYDQTTVYERLSDRNISWRIYHQGEAQSMVLVKQLEPQNVIHYHEMTKFFDDADPEQTDPKDFPQYSFIEPCYSGTGQNDQHPPSDIMKGEILIAQVYNALRNNDKLWATTLLVVLYDEHGGFHDHVTPPTKAEEPTVVAPDDHTDEFNFEQLGLRVPAILVSPWIDAKVIHTVFDHTSLLKYLTDKWNLGSGTLGRRTDQANTFAPELAQLKAMRTDTLSLFKDPLLSPLEAPNKNKVVNENQKALISFSQNLETHLKDDIAAVGSRALKMMEGPRGQFAVAKDRFERFIHQTKQDDKKNKANANQPTPPTQKTGSNQQGRAAGA
jgi:phospholipase C